MYPPQKCAHCPEKSVRLVSRQAGSNQESWRCHRGHSFVVTRPMDEGADAPPVSEVTSLND